MKKPSLKDDVPHSSREASSSSSRSNVSGIVPDDRIDGDKKSEDSPSSPDELAHTESVGGGKAKKPPPEGGEIILLQEKERIIGRRKTIKSKKALSADAMITSHTKGRRAGKRPSCKRRSASQDAGRLSSRRRLCPLMMTSHTKGRMTGVRPSCKRKNASQGSGRLSSQRRL